MEQENTGVDETAFMGALETTAAVSVLSMIEGLKSSGMVSQKAVRLAGFVLLEGVLGREVWRLVGLPDSTVYRWRAQVRQAYASGLIPDEPPAEFLEKVQELLERKSGENAHQSD